MTQYPDIRFRKCVDSGDKIDWFEVTESFDYYNFLTVPAGYKSDFASVPRLLWPIIPPHGRMVNASILHDYMYDRRLFEDTMTKEKARLYADKLFVYNCINDNVPIWQTFLVFTVIRILGHSWWVK